MNAHLMAHTKHGAFIYAYDRRAWGPPNSPSENYASRFRLLSLGLKSLLPRRKEADRVDTIIRMTSWPLESLPYW